MQENMDPEKAAVEAEDEISELELRDDVLEKKMRKLEAEAQRLLYHSSQLLKELTKSSSKEEEGNPQDNPESRNSSG
jgi:hypothetical protein